MKKLLALIILLALALSVVAQTKIGGGAKVGGTAKISVGGGGCTFPCSSVLDNFNRANEGPPPSANWTGQLDGTGGSFTVNSNQAAPTADPASMYWNASNFGADVEVYVTPAAFTTASARIHFRVQQEGGSGWDGYTVLAYKPANEIYVYRVDNGSQTQLGAAISQTWSDGDSFGASMIGSTITVYYCASGGACGVSGAGWTSKGTRSDSTYTSAGKIGTSTFDASGIRLDNFGGGTL